MKLYFGPFQTCCCHTPESGAGAVPLLRNAVCFMSLLIEQERFIIVAIMCEMQYLGLKVINRIIRSMSSLDEK